MAEIDSKTSKRDLIDQKKMSGLTAGTKKRVSNVLKAVREKYPKYNWAITEGYRAPERQESLYKIGRRGIPGEKVVTNARGGQSIHQQGRAVDLYPMTPFGIPSYEKAKEAYDFMGQIAAEQGFTWGGSPEWKGPKGDYGHIELPPELAALLRQKMLEQSYAV